MDKHINWLKVSKLTMDEAADVLRHRLSTIAQAPFLNDSESLWFETLQKIENTNCAASLLLRFTKDIRDKDDTCRRILRSLIMYFRSSIGNKMTRLEQVESLFEWEEEIEKHQRSSPSNVQEMLSAWCKQIKDTINTLNSMPTCIKTWTKDLLQLFQHFWQDLQKLMKEYYDLFINEYIQKLNLLESMKKTNPIKFITELERDRENIMEKWKMESGKYFKSVGQKIRECLTKWSQSTIIPEWKKLLDDFETEASEMDDTKLQLSCDTWHAELHDLIDEWLNKMEKTERKKRGVLLGQFLKKDLKQFPSIRSQQVKHFIISAVGNEKLQAQLSKKQKFTLFPSSGIPNLNEYDITLLSILLKSIVYPPMKGWNDDPPKCDKSLGADILRLQSFRSEILKHLNNFEIDTCEFVTITRDIKDVLCRLACRSGDTYKNKVCKEVDQIKRCSIKTLNLPDVYNIFKVCKNDLKAESKGKLKHHKYKKIKKSIRKVKRAKSRIKEYYEIDNSSSDSEGSESSRDSGILRIHLRRHSPFEHN